MKKDEYETDIEKLMRLELESRGLIKGIDFITQKPTRAGFILDFYFPGSRIDVEADGPRHINRTQHDRFRDYMHNKTGIKTLRFTDMEIYTDVKSCVDKIMMEIKNARR